MNQRFWRKQLQILNLSPFVDRKSSPNIHLERKKMLSPCPQHPWMHNLIWCLTSRGKPSLLFFCPFFIIPFPSISDSPDRHTSTFHLYTLLVSRGYLAPFHRWEPETQISKPILHMGKWRLRALHSRSIA